MGLPCSAHDFYCFCGVRATHKCLAFCNLQFLREFWPTPLPLMIHSALALFAQRTRIPTSARSIGFCAIWVCISSSSSSKSVRYCISNPVARFLELLLSLALSYVYIFPLVSLKYKSTQEPLLCVVWSPTLPLIILKIRHFWQQEGALELQPGDQPLMAQLLLPPRAYFQSTLAVVLLQVLLPHSWCCCCCQPPCQLEAVAWQCWTTFEL